MCLRGIGRITGLLCELRSKVGCKFLVIFILECQITGSWNRNSFKCHKMSSCNSSQALNVLNLKGTVCISQLCECFYLKRLSWEGFSPHPQMSFSDEIIGKSRGSRKFSCKGPDSIVTIGFLDLVEYSRTCDSSDTVASLTSSPGPDIDRVLSNFWWNDGMNIYRHQRSFHQFWCIPTSWRGLVTPLF